MESGKLLECAPFLLQRSSRSHISPQSSTSNPAPWTVHSFTSEEAEITWGVSRGITLMTMCIILR